MEAKSVTLWVYADNDQEVAALQNELNDFIMKKYKQGKLVRASSLRELLHRYGDSALVSAFLN